MSSSQQLEKQTGRSRLKLGGIRVVASSSEDEDDQDMQSSSGDGSDSDDEVGALAQPLIGPTRKTKASKIRAQEKERADATLGNKRIDLLRVMCEAKSDGKRKCIPCQTDVTVPPEMKAKRYTTRQLESHHEFAYHSQKLQFRRYLSKETGETYYFKDKEHKEDDIDYGDKNLKLFKCPFKDRAIKSCSTDQARMRDLEDHIAHKHLGKIDNRYQNYLRVIYLGKPSPAEKAAVTESQVVKRKDIGPRDVPTWFDSNDCLQAFVDRAELGPTERFQAAALAARPWKGTVAPNAIPAATPTAFSPPYTEYPYTEYPYSDYPDTEHAGASSDVMQ